MVHFRVMDATDALLATRQLQELLQVDRITICRMLDDGRLEGFKKERDNLLGRLRRIAEISEYERATESKRRESL
jgi:hypothetical protein